MQFIIINCIVSLVFTKRRKKTLLKSWLAEKSKEREKEDIKMTDLAEAFSKYHGRPWSEFFDDIEKTNPECKYLWNYKQNLISNVIS